MRGTRFMHVSLLAGLLWLAGARPSLGNGSDAALYKELVKIFPTATAYKSLSWESRFSKNPQVLEVRNGNTLLGYGVTLKVVSRSGPFRIVVAVAPDETVAEVRIPGYPHQRGRAVRTASFLEQFKGVAYGATLKLGREVDGVSGATSSATAVTGGVRQALLLVHRIKAANGNKDA